MWKSIKSFIKSVDPVEALGQVRRSAYDEGVDAYRSGVHLYSNPHVHQFGLVHAAPAWSAGWQWAWQQDNKERD